MWKSPWTRWSDRRRRAPRAPRARRGCAAEAPVQLGGHVGRHAAEHAVELRVGGLRQPRRTAAVAGGRPCRCERRVQARRRRRPAARCRRRRPPPPRRRTTSSRRARPARTPAASATAWPPHSTAPRRTPGRESTRRSRRGSSTISISGCDARPDPAEELHDQPLADDVGGVRLVDADGPLDRRRSGCHQPPAGTTSRRGVSGSDPGLRIAEPRPALGPDVAVGAASRAGSRSPRRRPARAGLHADVPIAPALPPNQRGGARAASGVGSDTLDQVGRGDRARGPPAAARATAGQPAAQALVAEQPVDRRGKLGPGSNA